MHESPMEQLWSSGHISGGNAAYVEELYDAYLYDSSGIPDEWREYFDQLPRINHISGVQDTPHSTIREQFRLLAKYRTPSATTTSNSTAVSGQESAQQINVAQLIQHYRKGGHLKATTDPLNLKQVLSLEHLSLHYHGLTPADLDAVFSTGDLFFGKQTATLKEIIEDLEKTYCGSIGAEITHITELKEVKWLQQRMESARGRPVYSDITKKSILERLTAAEGLEKHLDSKYPGTKRFGLEGGECLIPMLDAIIKRSGTYGAKEIVLGMAHRGRLNTLVNIFGKNPADLFDEFEGKKLVDTSGDVKYHQGFSSNVMTPGGEIHMAMAFNPSHLEIAAPVVEGSVRARQDRRCDVAGDLVVPISIHGDAAFAGQGVVFETFQMSQTRAYKTGGTVHIVINNQIGFTTSHSEDARSTYYCTDVAKFVGAPVFHVNGDDPEAVMFVTQLAVDYRYEFKKDVVIDLVCYRRRGHNETDEPSATQPLMYQVIKKLKTTRAQYAAQLINEGVLLQEESDSMVMAYRAALDRGDHVVNDLVSAPDKSLFVDWSPYLGHDWDTEGDTSFDLSRLQQLAHKCCEVPDGIQVQRQVQKIYKDRKSMASGALPINWGMAETLAYATLIEQGSGVRLTGQDVGRGTFSHRHAVIHGQKNGERYVPLSNLFEGQRNFRIFDSLLSEEAVLAFEYGYATTKPDTLVIWEAQFGDFANGAQVVIDQFITSGEHKWGRLCGLTMLLPHGYEGQGPEHSSARLERFMQLCAEHNMQVCIPTTPAQIFHILRRQVLRPMRRPLVIMSPKWILRHRLATSTLEELAYGKFHNVLAEQQLNGESVKRVILCSGKVYYHLLEERTERNIENIAIVRLEQLYPFPDAEFEQIMRLYADADSVVWCQEEPMNQGAWYHTRHHLEQVLQKTHPELSISYIGRPPSAAPAAGYMSVHLEEQKRFVDKALTL
ncbi:2-oxoglutarate dehydrogenase E1 component [Candidatus Endobugula sertula]|uniref:2-oxoglutarate dehydrogenase E1 component n=1 Tax=Candidatus Endobugula sertula TaxID=62101 RepID=A0A1D2QPF2_9GAMM|nr:2-oxoglutarate dehydrogenase E1 component [Candidatus Endobugula sertula]